MSVQELRDLKKDLRDAQDELARLEKMRAKTPWNYQQWDDKIERAQARVQVNEALLKKAIGIPI